jgi:antibiotic biosynthesis monooxygenase (ABM) superfamily enzyme
MARQMRRYELVPEHQEGFLKWWEQIPAGRAKFGFKVLSAHVDRVGHEFTWVVEHDGDEAAFKAAETAWMTSPERTALFEGQPKHTVQIHVSMVDHIF